MNISDAINRVVVNEDKNLVEIFKKGRRVLESFRVDHVHPLPHPHRQNDRCETMKRGDDVIIRKVQSILEQHPHLLPRSRLFSTPLLYFASIRV